ncbi:MAG: hypothetical protein ACKPKO_61805, partial [Candidatus Fonsibacter sp.]
MSSERFNTATTLSARNTDAEEEGSGSQCSINGGGPATRATEDTRRQEVGRLLTGVRRGSLLFLVGVVGMTSLCLLSMSKSHPLAGRGGTLAAGATRVTLGDTGGEGSD